MIIGLLLAGAGPACDWISLTGEPEVPSPTSPQRPTTDAATHDEGPQSYDSMCRHYCQALEETDLLGCVATGRQVDDCKTTTASTTGTCFDLRCRPHLVEVPLCLEQCDSLASLYNGRCPVSPTSPDPLCPTSPAEHDAACRAPCVL